MSGIWTDLTRALRNLARQPSYTVIAVATLALGIGANVAIFSVVEKVLLRPPPYPEPDRLVSLWEVNQRGGRIHVTSANFLDWKDQSQSFEGLAVHPSYAFGGSSTVLGGRDPVRRRVAAVSDDFFPIFRLRPEVGRAFTLDEFQLNAPLTTIVSYRFWQEQLAGNADLAALTLRFWGSSYHVVGVAPPGFDFPHGTDLWVPATGLNTNTSRTGHNWAVIGRLKSDVDLRQARAEMSGIAAALKSQFGEEIDAVDVTVRPLGQELAGSLSQPLSLLLGAAFLVLLTACVNIASASLAQGTNRQNEIALRSALGAGRRRIVRQLLTESLALGLLGAGTGILLAMFILAGFQGWLPAELLSSKVLEPDWLLLAFALAAALASTVAFGLYPALRLARTEVSDSLRQGGRSAARESRRGPWPLLMGAEVALALMLLAGAGLLIKSFGQVLQVDPGFDPKGVLTAELTLPTVKYTIPQAIADFYNRFLGETRSLPDVESAGIINSLPLGGSGVNGAFEVEGRTKHDAGYADYRIVDGEYFAAMKIPLLQGRSFDGRDHAEAPHALIVNKTLAERVWPGESALGKRVRNLANDSWIYPNTWLTVVGVVGDVHAASLTTPPAAEVYVHYQQRPARAVGVTAVVRSRSGRPQALAESVRRQLRSIDSEVPVEFSTMESQLSFSLAQRRFTTLVLGAFGATALLLSMAGIYGTVSYSVARRTREMGIRIALGALPRQVRGMIQRETLTVALAGTALGLIGAFFLTRLLESMLFEVSVLDPIAFGTAAAALLGAAWLAGYLPARRTSNVDPLTAIRTE